MREGGGCPRRLRSKTVLCSRQRNLVFEGVVVLGPEFLCDVIFLFVFFFRCYCIPQWLTSNYFDFIFFLVRASSHISRIWRVYEWQFVIVWILRQCCQYFQMIWSLPLVLEFFLVIELCVCFDRIEIVSAIIVYRVSFVENRHDFGSDVWLVNWMLWSSWLMNLQKVRNRWMILVDARLSWKQIWELGLCCKMTRRKQAKPIRVLESEEGAVGESPALDLTNGECCGNFWVLISPFTSLHDQICCSILNEGSISLRNVNHRLGMLFCNHVGLKKLVSATV